MEKRKLEGSESMICKNLMLTDTHSFHCAKWLEYHDNKCEGCQFYNEEIENLDLSNSDKKTQTGVIENEL